MSVHDHAVAQCGHGIVEAGALVDEPLTSEGNRECGTGIGEPEHEIEKRRRILVVIPAVVPQDERGFDLGSRGECGEIAADRENDRLRCNRPVVGLGLIRKRAEKCR